MCEKITRNAMICQTTNASGACHRGLKKLFCGGEGTGLSRQFVGPCSMLLMLSHPSLYLVVLLFSACSIVRLGILCIQNAFLVFLMTSTLAGYLKCHLY
jgi:hypothetical protein